MSVPVGAEKTSQVLSVYGYEIHEDLTEKEGELKSAKEKYEDILKEVEYLNSHNANIAKVDVNAIIKVEAEEKAKLSEMEHTLMTATDLTVSEILGLESDIKQQRTKCSILKEEIAYLKSMYTYDIPTDEVSEALKLVSQKAAEYDEAVRYGEIGDVTSVRNPLKGNYFISSSFGGRIDPLTGAGYDNHSGTDYACNTGTEVGALFSGTVIVAEWHYGMGNYVRIDHGDGIVTSYLHLSKINVKVGDKVKQYDTIGLSGGTGLWSTGPHLHLGLSINGKYVNVEKLFNG